MYIFRKIIYILASKSRYSFLHNFGRLKCKLKCSSRMRVVRILKVHE